MEAWFDESYRPVTQIYVVAAAFIPDGVDAIQDRFRAFGQFHWSKNRAVAIRLEVLALAVELGLDLRAVAARRVPGRAQERSGRARCFSSLLTDFAAAGGRKLVIDKRDTDKKNQRDTGQIQGFIDRGILPVDFGHSFERPSAHPIIRVADAVAGAVQAQLTEQDARYIEAIQARLRLSILP